MMVESYDESVEINRSPNWSYISDHSNRILIIDGSVFGRTNVLLDLIKYQRVEILTKFKKAAKIHWNQSINSSSTEEKK